MEDYKNALLSFGKLIGLITEDGGINWTWFDEPVQKSIAGIRVNRTYLGSLQRALLGRTDEDAQEFDASDSSNILWWEPLPNAAPVQFGFVWNAPPPPDDQNIPANLPLELGLAGRANIDIDTGKMLGLNLLVQLLKFSPLSGDLGVESALGRLSFRAGFPVPEFLTGGSLAGGYDPDGDNLSLSLTAEAAGDPPTRTLTIPTNTLEWDLPRLALFILHALVAKQAEVQPAGSFFRRLNDHLYPMLGSPSGAIASFPLLDDAMGSEPTFDDWKDSVLPPNLDLDPTAFDSEALKGPLTFLWHLRAIITGNEDSGVFTGSSWFPLVAGSATGPAEPQIFEAPDGYHYPPDPDAAGAWLGVRQSAESTAWYELVLELRSGDPSNVLSIPLLRFDTTALGTDRPPYSIPDVTIGTSDLAGFAAAIAISKLQFDQGTRLTLASETLTKETLTESGLPLSLAGTYSLDLILRSGQPLAFGIGTPLLDLELPPNPDANSAKAAARILLGNLLPNLIDAVAVDNAGPMGVLFHALTGFLGTTLTTGFAPSPETLFAALAAAVGNAVTAATGEDSIAIEFGPLALGVSGTELTPSLEIGPIQDKTANTGFSIGKLKLAAVLDIIQTNNPLRSVAFTIYDLRLGSGEKSAGSGLIASLIPDMREMDGFLLGIRWTPDGHPPLDIYGGGKIPIQKTLGPLEVVALLVDVSQESLSVGIDLAFQMSVIKVAVYELGLRFPFQGGNPELFLHGLALSFEGAGVQLSGLFLEVKKPEGGSDYVGGAVVKVVNLFELSAIGAYTEVPIPGSPDKTEASLFIFASLVAPLGGPPWCFITGIAGGFGFNRALPPPGQVVDHPFIKVMRGEIGFGEGAGAIAEIGAWFLPEQGAYWIAAGIQFNSFGFINGKLIAAIGFGPKFSFNLLGLAEFGLKPLAYFELGIEITADEERFLLQARLSSNSYIIHPDIFSLKGDFALGVWYASPHAGDFLLSIGGYHPTFERPDHYPELGRVGVKCVVYSFIRMNVECFFALTPQALMAGASLTLSAEFEGIGCGLDVYVDVFMRWDPFFLEATLGICVWFEFCGRHEIGVELKIHTPPFGGIAVIDLELVSFEIAFGDALAQPPVPRLDQFIAKQLGTPAKRDGEKAALLAFNSKEEAGLFRFDLLYGRTTQPQGASAEQEGIATPLPVNAEFAFSVKTKLPVNEDDPNGAVGTSLTGELDLALCELRDLSTALTVTGPNISKSQRRRLANYFPVAQFGEPLAAAQASDSGARQQVAEISAGERAVALTEGIVFDYVAEFAPLEKDVADLVGLAEEDSLEDQTHHEEFPLPLGWPGVAQTLRVTKSAAVFGGLAPEVKIVSRSPGPKLSLQESALKDIEARAPILLSLWQYFAELQRQTVGAPFKSLNYSAAVPILRLGPITLGPIRLLAPELPVIEVPASPRRRKELWGVNLRVVPPKASIRLDHGRLETRSPARNFGKRLLAEGISGGYRTAATVATGQTLSFELRGGRGIGQTLALEGQQTVRAIFQGGGGDFLMDTYLPGSGRIVAPERARRITLIGEGLHPPVQGARVLENLGVEHDSTLLALSPGSFAGHGCVLVSHTVLPFAAEAMDSVPGFQLLRALTNLSLYWPAQSKGACLVMVVEPLTRVPGLAAREIRWGALGARLSNLSTFIGPSATALVMDLTAEQPWQLEIDLGKHWRLAGVAMATGTSKDLAARLERRNSWDLVDDRLQAGPEPLSTRVVLEVTQ